MSDGTLPSRSGQLQGLSLIERFWAYAVIPKERQQDCWVWTGERQKAGYALIRHNGKRQTATRLSWSIHHGKPFPLGKIACHSCDNPRCVNPHHIWPGTNRDNVLDSIKKGRFRPADTCRRGHPRTQENTSFLKRPGRLKPVCKICRRENYRAKRCAT